MQLYSCTANRSQQSRWGIIDSPLGKNVDYGKSLMITQLLSYFTEKKRNIKKKKILGKISTFFMNYSGKLTLKEPKNIIKELC